MLIKGGLPESIRELLMQTLGLCNMIIGISNAKLTGRLGNMMESPMVYDFLK